MEKALFLSGNKVGDVPPHSANQLNVGATYYGECDAAHDEGERRMPTWKRAFDITLIVLTAPIWVVLMALCILLVKLVSPGPAIYRQRRIGHGGREFTIFKIRSMHVNADVGHHEQYVQSLIGSNQPMTKLDSADARVIPGGRFLRAIALDELPQIFNVLRGEMSLVGPRPCTPREFACYTPHHTGRVAVPPGLTGLWQVKGKNNLTFDEMIELDLRYCSSMSLTLDAWIVVSTFPTLAGQVLCSLRKKHLHARAGKQSTQRK